jgi:hypothetical protein
MLSQEAKAPTDANCGSIVSRIDEPPVSQIVAEYVRRGRGKSPGPCDALPRVKRLTSNPRTYVNAVYELL